MTPSDFIKAFKIYALENQLETGVPYLITLAQAALESGWGKHAPGNNFFGIKDSNFVNYGRQIKTTKEYLKGKMVLVEAAFETYPSPGECFKHHAQLLQRQFPLAFQFKDPIAFIAAVQHQHFFPNRKPKQYATDPNYVELITRIIRILQKAEDKLEKENLTSEKGAANTVVENYIDMIPKGLEKPKRKKVTI